LKRVQNYRTSLRRFLARALYGSSNGPKKLAIVIRSALAILLTTSSVAD
jgi:hypothetical protein